jgi:hypothetical protein
MNDPYDLTNEEVDQQITQASSGNYDLGNIIEQET